MFNHYVARSVSKTPSATPHTFLPAIAKPPANRSRNQALPTACADQTYCPYRTRAASPSSTTRIAAPSTRAASTSRNTPPIAAVAPIYKIRLALAPALGHPPPPNSIPLHPSVARCAPHHLPEITSRIASAPQQNCACPLRPSA